EALERRPARSERGQHVGASEVAVAGLQAAPRLGRLVQHLAADADARGLRAERARDAKPATHALAGAVTDGVVREGEGGEEPTVDADAAEVVADRRAREGPHRADAELHVLVLDAHAAEDEGILIERAAEGQHRAEAHRETETTDRAPHGHRER